MVENESPLYYLFYAIILIVFYFVLKSPKKEKDNKDESK